MLRLRMWIRVGLLALLVATSTAWVTITATPAHAATTTGGSKSMDPGGDPNNGGGTNVGDPDGPSGDISPTGGVLRTNTGANGSAVQAPTVSVATPTQQISLWARIRLALGYWLRAGFLRL